MNNAAVAASPMLPAVGLIAKPTPSEAEKTI